MDSLTSKEWNRTSFSSSTWWVGLLHLGISSVSIVKGNSLKTWLSVLTLLLHRVWSNSRQQMAKIISFSLRNESFRNINAIQDGLSASMTLLLKNFFLHIYAWKRSIGLIWKWTTLMKFKNINQIKCPLNSLKNQKNLRLEARSKVTLLILQPNQILILRAKRHRQNQESSFSNSIVKP